MTEQHKSRIPSSISQDLRPYCAQNPPAGVHFGRGSLEKFEMDVVEGSVPALGLGQQLMGVQFPLRRLGSPSRGNEGEETSDSRHRHRFTVTTPYVLVSVF